ncbi:MAG: hypothetical protein AAF965_01420 [Pseudomonadota bacterium]
MNWFWYYDIVDRRLLAFVRKPTEPVNTVFLRASGLSLTYLALIPMLMSFPFVVIIRTVLGEETAAGSIFMLSFTGLTWVYLLICHVIRKRKIPSGDQDRDTGNMA